MLRANSVVDMNILNKFLILFLALSTLGVQKCQNPPLQSIENPIIGSWLAHRYVYDGNERVIQHTIMSFKFEDGFSYLYWRDKEQTDFCERKAFYRFKEPVLWQKVIWTNPKNAIECSQDPDMQIGHVTENNIKIENDELYLFLSLGDKEMIYIFKRTEPTHPQP